MNTLERSKTGAVLTATIGLALAAMLLPQSGNTQVPLTETLTFACVADGYVDASSPGSNYDADARLRADAEPARTIYLRFAVTGVDGRRVEQARLRLQVSGPNDDSGGTIHVISDDSWDESTLTFNTRPAVDGPGLETLGAVTQDEIVEFHLDGVITRDGVYNIAIDSTSTDGVSYVSTVPASGEPPRLVVILAPAPEPVVTIVQPPDGSVFFRGDPAQLQATVVDDEWGLESFVEWTSDRDGALGTGGCIAPLLSEGAHAVTASVADSDGFSGRDQIGITVVSPPHDNTEPLVTITAPLDGQTFSSSAVVSFTGTAADLEDGPLTNGLSWTSNRDGSIGYAGSFATRLSEGTHDVKASVVDSGDREGSATVRLHVIPPGALELIPVADAYVDEGAKATNYGASTRLSVDADWERVTYLRFFVIGVGARAVERAALRMTVESTPGSGSDSGGTVQTISDTSWNEDAVTYETRPAVDGPALASAGPVSPGETVEFDLTRAVDGDGIYNFALTSSSTNGVNYESRETGSPRLVLVLDEDAPVVTITPAADGTVVFNKGPSLSFTGKAPVVTITAPPDGTVVFKKGLSLHFTGKATDAEDGNLERLIVWRSDLNGYLGRGSSIRVKNLVVGKHTITATVTDSDGLTGQAEIHVYVRASNARPDVTITAPVDGAEVPAQTPIMLTATATDDFDGDISHRIAWNSDRDGNLGAGADLTVILTEGSHKITASVTDSDGATDKDEITVNARARAPVVTILEPPHASEFTFADRVSFVATAVDPDDGNISETVTWRSDIQGLLGAGASLVTYTLSIGMHRITATAVDRDGRTGSDQITVEIEQPSQRPVVSITAPMEGSVIGEGESLSFEATAIDLEDGNLSGRLDWYSDLEGPLGTGATVSTTLTVVGTHWITAAVSDSHGLMSIDGLTVTVTPAPPTVTIVSPADYSEVTGPIAFSGTAMDFRDGDLSGDLIWTSSVDGMVGLGPVIPAVHLTPGLHVVTAEVTDSDKAVGSASISIVVGFDLPVVEILEPVSSVEALSEFTVERGEPVTFRGTASDASDQDLSPSLRWISDLNGLLGTGASITVSTLVRGRHVITAEVTDGRGLTGSAQTVVLVTVLSTNNEPTVHISEPVAGAVVDIGAPVTFSALAEDDLDGDLSVKISWVSNLDGLMGRGSSLTTTIRSVGKHAVTASVANSLGLLGTATVHVTVVPPWSSFEAEADTYDDHSDTDTNFGTSAELLLGRDPARRIYLRFAATGLGDAPVESAVVRMRTTSHSSAGSDHGGMIYLTTDDNWDELTLTHTHSPALDPSPLDSVGPVVPSQTVDFDVTSAIDGDGTYSFAITALSDDVAIYRAREAALDRPELIVFFEPPSPQKPRVEIIEPPFQATVPIGVPVVFKGTAYDAQDGDLDVAIIWKSDVDWIFGVGPSVVRKLRPGPHIITATANDVDGNPGADLIHVFVGDGLDVAIDIPADGVVVPFGEQILFSGSAFDRNDGDLSPFLEWSSSIDGPLGMGASLRRALSAGAHTVTAGVTDNDGKDGSASINLTVTIADVGFEDFRYGPGVDQDNNRITGSKPESKLWYAGGIWWATLFSPATAAYTIHRLDMATQKWVNTGIVIDERPTSRQDVLIDGKKLYLVSRMTDPPGQNRLLRYTYYTKAQTFVLDAGFPVNIAGGGTESMTIAKDFTQTLWIAYTLGEQVFVNHTVGSDSEWATPFVVPIADEDPDAATVSPDDIAGVVAIDGAVGVFWSNQLTNKDYFAVHRAGEAAADPASWILEVAATGGRVADDHFNMKLASDGRLFVAVKTSRTAAGSTLIGLLVRSPQGAWSELHHVTSTESQGTRPICLLDEVHRTVHVFYSPLEGAIYTKASNMDAIAFPDPVGIGEPFITNSDAAVINNATSAKQNVDPQTGLVVLASGSGRYWHGTIDPQPALDLAISTPSNGL